MGPPPPAVGRDQAGPYAFFAHRAEKDAHPACTLSFAVVVITSAALVMRLGVTQLSEECTYEMRPPAPRQFSLLSRPRRPSSPATRRSGIEAGVSTGYPILRYLAGGRPTSRLKALRKATSDS